MPQTRTPKDLNQRATTAKNQYIMEISVPSWTRKSRLKSHKLILATKTVENSILNNNKNINKSNENSNTTEPKPKTVYPRCKTWGKTNHSTGRCYVWANAAKRPLPWKSKPEGQSGHHQQDAQNSITGCVWATAQHLDYKCHIFTPEWWVTETTRRKF